MTDATEDLPGDDDGALGGRRPADPRPGSAVAGSVRSVSAGGPWRDPFGRAGARAGQLLMIGAVVAGSIWLLLRISVVLVAVLVALILAAAVSPLVRWLVSKGWTQLLATVAAFVGILLLLSATVTGIVFAVRSEWDDLAASAADGWEALKGWVGSLPLPIDASAVDDAWEQIAELIMSGGLTSGLASNTISGLSAVTQFLTGLVLMAVVLFFLLKDGSQILNFGLRWFSGDTREKLAESAERSAGVLGGYVRGTAIIAFVDAVLIGIGIAIVGVPLALPLAVIVFVGGFIPIIGATVAGALAAMVALVANGPVEALVVLAIVIGVQQLEGNLLQPVVMGRTLSLHALIVLLALTIGTIIGGFFGALLAVPYTAVGWTLIQIWSDRYQSGHDPVLGDDPVGPRPKRGAGPTALQRRFAKLRRRT